MEPANSAVHPCNTVPSQDRQPSPVPGEKDDGPREYPDVGLPVCPDPYILRTRINESAIFGVEKTTAQSGLIISEGLFPDRAFPVAPSEFIYGLDNFTYSLDDHRWLLNYPSLEVAAGDRERAMAAFLNRLVQICWIAHEDLGEPVPSTPRQWITTQTPRLTLQGEVERFHGIALVEAGVEPQWRDVLCDVQMVPTEDEMPDALYQLSCGAYNMFASQEDRLFSVGLAIAGDTFQLVYHDRAGRVLSDAFGIHTDPILFIRIILGVSLLGKSFGGKDTSIVTRDGQRFVSVGGIEYEILETLSLSKDLHGSGTICWRCRRDGTSENFVIKSVWADMERKYSEGDLLQLASAIDGVPHLDCEAAVSRCDGTPCTTKWCEVLHPSNRWARRTIPQLALRRLVLRPYAKPLEDFASKEEFLGAFRDAVAAHQKLYDIYGLLHCDISDNNIMLREYPGSPMRRGLLIDLDCAAHVTGSTGHSRTAFTGYRTGTLPFMACDLLLHQSCRHGPWHDLESFLHVLIFVCASYAGPSSSPRRDVDLCATPLKPWLEGDGVRKAHIMRELGDEEFRAFLESVVHPYFDDLKVIVCELRSVIMCPREEVVRHQDVLDVLDRHIEARRSVPQNPATPSTPPTSRTSPAPKHPASPKRKRQITDDAALSTPPRTPETSRSYASEGSEHTLINPSSQALSIKKDIGLGSTSSSPKRQKMV
ncbi:hypothetical protein K525DRAFT_198214 [Schizophyllum commune Loenen D]|nr:hypothetical protein K525DRAFT_198214 [Schizophyllum commune Loenen D]